MRPSWTPSHTVDTRCGDGSRWRNKLMLGVCAYVAVRVTSRLTFCSWVCFQAVAINVLTLTTPMVAQFYGTHAYSFLHISPLLLRNCFQLATKPNLKIEFWSPLLRKAVLTFPWLLSGLSAPSSPREFAFAGSILELSFFLLSWLHFCYPVCREQFAVCTS